MAPSEAWSGPSSYPGGNPTAVILWTPHADSHSAPFISAVPSARHFFPTFYHFITLIVPRWISSLDCKPLEGWNYINSNSSVPITVACCSKQVHWMNKWVIPAYRSSSKEGYLENDQKVLFSLSSPVGLPLYQKIWKKKNQTNITY